MKLLNKIGSATRGGRRVRRGPLAAGNVPHMPSKWWKRWLWYSNPKRFTDFWFSHEGGKAALRIVVGIGGAFVGFVVALFLYFAKDLPSPGQINSKVLEQTTRFYDRTGEHLLYEVHGDKNRTVVDLKDMSKHILAATIAIEDKNFYKHGAFSSLSILRAAVNNVLNRGSLQGGSTITQQYVKNSLLTGERTFTRKIKELILSIQIEQRYNKDDILKLYLNEIPYGAQAYGVQAAAKTFFDKDAKDLTIEESALLAALPRAPTYYSPYGENVDELIGRKDLIIDLMADQGYIKPEQAAKAKKVDVYKKVNDVPNLYANITAPHFVLAAQHLLEEKYGIQKVENGGLQVITTLDIKHQKKAEKAVAKGIGVVDANGGNNAALVSADPKSGEILSMVGSRGFSYPGFGAFNAALAERQPGSSFKPYVYAAGFATGKWGPGSVMYDVRTDFGGGYVPNNYDNRFRGPLTIRKALASSFNIPAVKMLYIVGMDEALKLAHEVGITTLQDPANYGLSLVLGAGEVKLADHVNGFETFANGGLHYPATYIKKVTESNGNILEEYKDPQPKRVMDEEVAYAINHILSDPVARSLTFTDQENFTVPGHQVATKTGTTDSARDGWMMQYSPNLVSGVWVGHNKNLPMGGITSRITGPIVNTYMRSALKDMEAEKFNRPAGIKSVALNTITGRPGGSNVQSDIFPSFYTPPKAAEIQSYVINKYNDKLATSCTPTSARKRINNSGLTAEIPSTDPAFPRWNPPVQALAKSMKLGGGAIPTEKDDCKGPTVSITNVEPYGPGDTIKISFSVQEGSSALESITVAVTNLKKNKNEPCSGSISTKKRSFSCKPTQSGDYRITVRVVDESNYSDSDPVEVNDYVAFGGNNGNAASFFNFISLGWLLTLVPLRTKL